MVHCPLLSPRLTRVQDDHMEEHRIGKHPVRVQELLQERAQLVLVVHMTTQDHVVLSSNCWLVGLPELRLRVDELLDVVELAGKGEQCGDYESNDEGFGVHAAVVCAIAHQGHGDENEVHGCVVGHVRLASHVRRFSTRVVHLQSESGYSIRTTHNQQPA